MKYRVHINQRDYNDIIHGTKRIEVHLNHKFYPQIKSDDTIEFYNDDNQSFHTKVIEILKYDSFESLIDDNDISLFSQNMTKKELLDTLYKFYTPEQEKQCGVLGIRIKPFPQRKQNRIPEYDYSQNGAYFVTICTANKEQVLGEVVESAHPDVPYCELTKIGKIAKYILEEMATHYNHTSIDNYVIMPNHIHMIIAIENLDNGTSRTPSPTNSTISSFISTFKRFTNKEAGFPIWQRSFYDHVIRNDKDYQRIWEYIETNLLKWSLDEYYNE